MTNGTAEGVDMVTLEARAYGVARHVRRSLDPRTSPKQWMIVNDVAGFIGPEVFTTAGQLERACLEDVVMAKLHGITMCSTCARRFTWASRRGTCATSRAASHAARRRHT